MNNTSQHLAQDRERLRKTIKPTCDLAELMKTRSRWILIWEDEAGGLHRERGSVYADEELSMLRRMMIAVGLSRSKS